MYRTKTVDDEKKYKKNEPEKVRFIFIWQMTTKGLKIAPFQKV